MIGKTIDRCEQFLALLLVTAILVPCAMGDEPKRLSAVDRVEQLPELAQRYFQPLVEHEWAVGIVVGVVDEHGTRVLGFGRAGDDQLQSPTGQTLFEIGSVTKVFTALLLADMAEQGRVRLNQSVSELLPEDIGPLMCGERPMQLVDLATHTSGLPRLPPNLVLDNLDDPYAAYTNDMLYACLHEHAKPSAVKSLSKSLTGLFETLAGKQESRPQWQYSNLGVGLLGHLLERRAGRPYEELVIDRICRPLGMHHTRVDLDAALRANSTSGHDADGRPVSDWNLACLVAAGGLRSSADDMLRFLAAQLDMIDTPLKPAIATTQQSHFRVKDGLEMGLGWMLATPKLAIHDGMTGGYCSFVGFSREHKLGIVVLSNTSLSGGVLGRTASAFFKALREAEPGEPPPIRGAIRVDPAVLQKYAGKYTLVPLVATLTVTSVEDRLFAQLTGQPRFRIYPESETQFFYKVVDAQLKFECDASGRVERVVLHQNGKDMSAARQ
jgi:serine-type D-Ala-D-Ala carboxypeptidase/endopeptidase